jgi:hypothetical protein
MQLRTLYASTVAAALTMAALPAGAQSMVRVQFDRGVVSVEAHGAPLAAVLEEWARVGGVTIANAEQLPAGRTVTLNLVDVPEDQLLDALLGGVSGSGYLVTRRPPGTNHASAYERMWLVPRVASETTESALGEPPAPRGQR